MKHLYSDQLLSLCYPKEQFFFFSKNVIINTNQAILLQPRLKRTSAGSPHFTYSAIYYLTPDLIKLACGGTTGPYVHVSACEHTHARARTHTHTHTCSLQRWQSAFSTQAEPTGEECVCAWVGVRACLWWHVCVWM